MNSQSQKNQALTLAAKLLLHRESIFFPLLRQNPIFVMYITGLLMCCTVCMWFFLCISLLEYNCFTMLCQFLLYNKVNQLHVYIYPHIPFLLSLPPTFLIPPLQVVTKHQTDFPVLCSSFPLAIHFTFSSIYTSMLLSHFIPASPSHPVSSSPLSMSASLFLPCPQVHQYHFFRFLMCALVSSICFSLSDFHHSV